MFWVLVGAMALAAGGVAYVQMPRDSPAAQMWMVGACGANLLSTLATGGWTLTCYNQESMPAIPTLWLAQQMLTASGFARSVSGCSTTTPSPATPPPSPSSEPCLAWPSSQAGCGRWLPWQLAGLRWLASPPALGLPRSLHWAGSAPASVGSR